MRGPTRHPPIPSPKAGPCFAPATDRTRRSRLSLAAGKRARTLPGRRAPDVRELDCVTAAREHLGEPGMTLVIQRAEHRDTQAIHAKLDELLKAEGNADNDVMGIDDKDAEEVESERKEIRAS
jgi:Low affinity iron permease